MPPEKGKRPPPLPPEKATAEVRRMYLEGCPLVQTRHFRQELGKANATMQDAENVLENGYVLRPAEWKKEHRSWHYAVTGTDIEEEPLTVVVAIDDEGFRLVLVTAW